MSCPELSPGLRAILAGAVDYAGLFPPTALPLETAVANYRGYRQSSDRWALGRFVVTAARLPELTDVLARAEGPEWAGTRISATAGAGLTDDFQHVARFNVQWRSRAIAVDAVEARVTTTEAIDAFAARVSGGIAGYGEVPLGPDHDGLLGCLKGHRLNAKIRMGGVSRDLFPGVEGVVAFLLGVAARQLPFKATAGLHHPLRGEYRLTYDDGSARAPMYGFLNLAVATLVALDNGPADQVAAALLEANPTTIRSEGLAVQWRGRVFDSTSIDRLRQLFHGFGSCSFREPIDELEPALCR